MTMYRWFKTCHGIVADDKWPLIARKSGQSVAVVIAVWLALLECASEAEERGCIEDFDPENTDAILQIPDGTCEKILTALSEGRNPRIQDEFIVNWNKRQECDPKDPTATERKRRQRARDKQYREMESRGKMSQYEDESQEFLPECHGVTRDTVTSTVSGHENTVPSRTDIRKKEYKKEEIKHRESTENEDYAPAREASQAVFENSVLSDTPVALEGKVLPPAVAVETGHEPSLEFLELREFYSREARAEGEMSGFVEYKQAKAAHDWPGIARIITDVDARIKAGAFKTGYAPGLRRYLTERFWKAPIVAQARERPFPTGSPNEVTAKNAGNFQRVLASMVPQAGGEQ